MASARRILISRTDAIGDVILTLPVATILKQHFPQCHIGFLGKNYTRPIIECCSTVDEFVNSESFFTQNNSLIQKWDTIIHVFPRKEIALKAFSAGISQRIGTSSRPYHWFTCNKLVKLNRKNSNLHEAQLNTRLLIPFGIADNHSASELGHLFSFDKIPPLPGEFKLLIEPGKKHIILHPRSKGSAREWGLDNFISLIHLLPKERFQIFISGTKEEAALIQPLFEAAGDRVTDIAGQMDLSTFIAFINACDGLVAASTGPLHIAAALGKTAIGIYPSIRPMHPGRWAPLGPNAVALSLEKDCNDCRKVPEQCACIRSISAIEIANLLQ